MPKNKGKASTRNNTDHFARLPEQEANIHHQQGGKNRRRGKNENDNEKRELTFKEEGQGTFSESAAALTSIRHD